MSLTPFNGQMHSKSLGHTFLKGKHSSSVIFLNEKYPKLADCAQFHEDKLLDCTVLGTGSDKISRDAMSSFKGGIQDRIGI